MTFSDVFKTKFLNNLQSVGVADMLVALGMALVIGLAIFLVYRRTYSGVMYSASFGVGLVALTLITTLVILAVSSNVVLSLGMVGALSIVRFRAAIKDPMDLVFLFWAIAAGIVLAAGMPALAALASVVIAAVLLVMSGIRTSDDPYMLMVSFAEGKGASEAEVMALVKGNVKRAVVKGKTVSPRRVELNIEVRLIGGDTSFVDELGKLAGVGSVTLVSFGGEYMSQ